MDGHESKIVCLDHEDDEDLAAGLRRSYKDCPKDVRMHLNALFAHWVSAGGIEEASKQMNGKHIGDLLKTMIPSIPAAITQGEIDGVKYRLYGNANEKES